MSNQATEALQKLLNETATHPKIKQTLMIITRTRQKITYHALVSSTETYLQLRGLSNHDQQEFNYINKMLHSKIVGALAKIKRKQINLRDLEQEARQEEQERIKQQEVINQQMIAEVEHVINNVDLPLSLFKRNDKYWYQDNPKTIQAKNYVHERMKDDHERKKKIRSQRIKRQTEREKAQRQRSIKQMKQQEARRKKYREEVMKKIQNYKKNSLMREKNIQQSQKYTASLKPLYIKLQESQAMSQATALEQQKKRLSQLRKLHKSIDFTEIEQHKKKLLEIQKQKQIKRIFDEPVKVSYKSKYHTSMTARSRINQYQTTKSLYERKKEYGQIIKSQFQPKIDENLVQQMQERLKLMRRKRTRKNPKKKQPKKKKGNGEDDDEDEQEEQEQQPEPQKPVQNDDEDYDSQDDEERQKRRPPLRKLGEDDDYDRAERYQLGVQYLEYARNARKKRKQDDQTESKQPTNQDKQPNENQQQFLKQQKAKSTQRYKDYLKQFIRTNRSTIDHIDTTRMKQQYNKSIIGKNTDYTTLSQLENHTRKVQEKINREEQLLRFKKMKNQDAVSKKVQIDNAVIQTIKARLALMGK